MKRAISTLGLIVLTLSILPARAQLHWDGNGDAAGAGTTPTGTWGTDNFWNPDANGGPSPGAWTDGNLAVFAAGGDATGTYTVTVSDTQSVGGITFEEGTVTLSGGTLDFPSGGDIEVLATEATINSVISGGAGQLNLNPNIGGGTLVLGGASTFNNTFSVAFGTLRMGASGDILPNATVSIAATKVLDLNNNSVAIGSLGGGTLSVNSSVTLGSGTLTNLGMVPNNRYDGIISGTGGLVKAGTNTLTLSAANTYEGKTAILGGVLSLNTTAATLGTAPASYVADQITLDNGTLNFPAASPLSIPAEGGIYLGPGGGAITMGSSKAPNIYPNITGPGALLKSSTGNMSLWGTNTFEGDFTILAGGVRFNSDFSAGTGDVIVSPVANVFLRNLTPPGNISTLTNAITVNVPTAGVADLNAASPDVFIVSGPISGAGPLERGQQTGSSGTVVLSGDNSGWGGGLTLWRGKLALGHKDALGTTALTIRPALNANPALNNVVMLAWTPLTGANAVTTPVSIDITNNSFHFSFGGTNALEFSGAVDLGTNTPTINVTNTGGTILSGPITGASGIGLTKDGADTLTLSGANTYDGVTTVNAGTLLVNSPGSLAGGGVVVNSGGTLGGDGTINGSVAVNSGGSVGAGGSVGILTLASGLDLSGGGTNVWELGALKDDSDGTAGTDFDQIAVGGTLTLGGSSTLKLAFTGTASEPDGSAFWDSAHSWTIISDTGAASTFATIENGVYPEGTFGTSAEAGGIVLTFTPGAGLAPVTTFTISQGPGSDLTLNYSGGAGAQFVLVQTNNVAAPLSDWTRVQTNISASGSFTITPGSDPQQFYRVKSE